MSNYGEFIATTIGIAKCKNNHQYPALGKTYCFQNETTEGIYWFYETPDFIIDIHNFYVKKEMVETIFPELRNYLSFSTVYIMNGSGESFYPYQTLSSHSVLALDVNRLTDNFCFLLHANSPFLSVGIHFKNHMIKNTLTGAKQLKQYSQSEIVLKSHPAIANRLETFAREILTCSMSDLEAKHFFEVTANEWLKIVLDGFFNQPDLHLSTEDDQALSNVANYLNDHYALNVSQETLEKIAMMSGTKLKKRFKEKYRCSITEYIQRKRVNIAENLLLYSSLKIQDVALAVGYTSHSKFSACFKKYKGVFPRDIKKYPFKDTPISHCKYNCTFKKKTFS